MKELILILIALLVASFLVSVPRSDEDWFLYMGELRMYEISAEADTLKARSLIFARSWVDRWLAEVNATACEELPLPPNGSLFVQLLREDMTSKGFSVMGDLRYSIGESREGDASDKAFGGYCRDGGIKVIASSRLTIRDDLLGIKARRYFGIEACQPTAYFLIREVLTDLRHRTISIVREAFSSEENVTAALQEMREELASLVRYLRRNLTDEGISLRLTYTTEFAGEEIAIAFKAVVFDEEAIIIRDGRLRRGFSCIREWEIRVRGS
ncbi:MAG: hypothetical protein QI197_00535 [Candidatus Korarchaeota archaeon]|nr:hypothetical protein [Candidatus Korarchaeota archaeon]